MIHVFAQSWISQWRRSSKGTLFNQLFKTATIKQSDIQRITNQTTIFNQSSIIQGSKYEITIFNLLFTGEQQWNNQIGSERCTVGARIRKNSDATVPRFGANIDQNMGIESWNIAKMQFEYVFFKALLRD